MSEHKCPLIIVGHTHAGKSRALIAHAMDKHKIANPGSVTVVISDEMLPSNMHEMAEDVVNGEVHLNANLFFISPKDALSLVEDFQGKEINLFIDCVSQTSIGVDHEGIRVGFQGIHGDQLNGLLAASSLQGVTVSNWGQ